MAFTPLFRGAGCALVTPFTNGQVNVEQLRRLVNWQIEQGTAALVACGTTGEPATMTMEEKELVVRETVETTAGRVPVICGTGSNNTMAVIETEKRFRNLGCAAQLVVTPYYNRTTQEGLYRHFMTIAENTELPIILYNVPSRTNVDISADTLRRLSASGRFIALKESSAQINAVMAKMEAIEGKMALYSGSDDMVYPFLTIGADGVISVISDVVPAEMAKLCSLYFEGRQQEALKQQIRLLPLNNALFHEVSPIPCKYAMEKLGLCSGDLRLPLVEASEETRAMMDKALAGLGL